MWTVSVTGHLSQGEDSITGALKELEEEIGIIANKKDLRYLFTVKEYKVYRQDYIDNELIDVFIVKKDIDIKDLKMQKEEVSAVKFVQYKELEKMIKSDSSDIVEHTEMYKKLGSECLYEIFRE
jgi:isopentenyldiphosphate isomerase